MDGKDSRVESFGGWEVRQAANPEPLLDDGLEGSRVLHPFDEADVGRHRNHLGKNTKKGEPTPTDD